MGRGRGIGGRLCGRVDARRFLQRGWLKEEFSLGEKKMNKNEK